MRITNQIHKHLLNAYCVQGTALELNILPFYHGKMKGNSLGRAPSFLTGAFLIRPRRRDMGLVSGRRGEAVQVKQGGFYIQMPGNSGMESIS